MRQADLTELDHQLMPKKKLSCNVIACYGCVALLGAGTYVLSFFAGYHLRESEDRNTTFFDRG